MKSINQKSVLALALILATLLTSTLKAAEKLPNGGAAYSKEEVQKIAKTIVDLQNCERESALQKQFIDQKMAETHEPSWWQEPSVVIGGVVVGFSLGVAITALVIKSK